MTYEFIALFVYYKIIKNAGSHYDKANIYVLNDEDATGAILSNTLTQLNLLKNGDNAKIIYISEIHAITLYLGFGHSAGRA